MKNKIISFELVVIILFFALFVFFYKLDLIPNGFYVDEAVSGYNSYSILLTSNDEYGKFLPVVLRYFGSYTPPLYAYLSILPIKLFGLNVFSARFISAVSGLLSLFATYVLLKNLELVKGKYESFVAVFIYLISPWVVFYSRIGYEVYFGYFFYLIGIIYLLKGLKKPIGVLLGSIFLTISCYTSHTQKYVFLLILPLYLLVFLKNLNLRKNFKIYIFSIISIFVILMPYLSIVATKSFFIKNNLFYESEILGRAEKARLYGIFSYPLSALYEFSARYISYFSPKSLFFLPDPDVQRSLPNLSVFYSWMVLPYLVGLFFLFNKRKLLNFKFIIFLLLASSLPASLTREPFSTQRALPFMLPVFLVVWLGVKKLATTKNFIVLLFLGISILIYSPLVLWRDYFVLFPKERAVYWNYGLDRLTNIILKNKNTKFVIDQTRQKPLYIEYAFFAKYDPRKMQSLYSKSFVENYYNDNNFNPPEKLDNLEFRAIDWIIDDCQDSVLVGDSLSFSEDNIKDHFLSKKFEIRDPRGEILFLAYRTNPDLKCNK